MTRRINRLLTIPEVRARLLELANGDVSDHTGAHIRMLVRHMYRRKPIRKTRVKSAKMTEALREAIRVDWRTNPDASEQEIAARHHVNSGRVSETIAGFRA